MTADTTKAPTAPASTINADLSSLGGAVDGAMQIEQAVSTAMKTKRWYTSKTVWGGLIGGAVGVAGAFLHFTLAPGAAADLAGLAVSFSTTAAAGFAIYGRFKANTLITK